MRSMLITSIVLCCVSCSWMEEHHPINGFSTPDLVVDSNPSYFDGVSEERVLVVTNVGYGEANVRVHDLLESTTDDPGGQEFHLVSPAELDVERSLQTDDELSIVVRYEPADDEPDRALIRVITNDPKWADGILEIELIVGQPPPEEGGGPEPFDLIAPRALDMRPVSGTGSNDGLSKSFRIYNGGLADLHVRAIRQEPESFELLYDDSLPPIPSGERFEVRARWSDDLPPSSWVTVAFDEAAPRVKLLGREEAPCLTAQNSGEVDFAEVPVGSVAEHSLTLESCGLADGVNVVDMRICTDDGCETDSRFTIEGGLEDVRLDPGEQSEVVVTFEPTAPGAYDSEIVVRSDALDSPLRVQLRGVAQ